MVLSAESFVRGIRSLFIIFVFAFYTFNSVSCSDLLKCNHSKYSMRLARENRVSPKLKCENSLSFSRKRADIILKNIG